MKGRLELCLSVRVGRSGIGFPLGQKAYHGQRMNWHRVLSVIWQVLVQIGQGVRVLAELLIHNPKLVSSCGLPVVSLHTLLQ